MLQAVATAKLSRFPTFSRRNSASKLAITRRFPASTSAVNSSPQPPPPTTVSAGAAAWAVPPRPRNRFSALPAGRVDSRYFSVRFLHPRRVDFAARRGAAINGTVFKYKPRKIENETTPALDFACGIRSAAVARKGLILSTLGNVPKLNTGAQSAPQEMPGQIVRR